MLQFIVLVMGSLLHITAGQHASPPLTDAVQALWDDPKVQEHLHEHSTSQLVAAAQDSFETQKTDATSSRVPVPLNTLDSFLCEGEGLFKGVSHRRLYGVSVQFGGPGKNGWARPRELLVKEMNDFIEKNK